MYDCVLVKCPVCGSIIDFQSKSGDCFLKEYTLENCPDDVMRDVNRHSPEECECGAVIEIDVKNRKTILVKKE